MAPSWSEKDGAAGALMGNEPAGHMQRQLHPPFWAACSADATDALLDPEPAMTVTAALALEVVEALMRPSLVRVAVLMEGAANDDEPARTAAELPLTVAVMVFVVVVVVLD
jgi:hypothetical protein